MTFGLSVASTEDEKDDGAAIWKDAAVLIFVLRSYGNSQHIVSKRRSAGNFMRSIRGNVLVDASPASCTANTGALSLGIRRSDRDTDGRRLSNVCGLVLSLLECRYKTVRRETLSYHAMKMFQMADLSFTRTILIITPRGLVQNGFWHHPVGIAVYFTNNRAARA